MTLARKTPMKRAEPAQSPKLRPKRCKVCREQFQPRSSMHVACSPTCALVLAAKAREKQAQANYRARKEAAKSRVDWMKEAQQAFNAFIRERDKMQPCICCGKPLKGHDSLAGHNVDAGHYRSVGSAPHLRFDERNCHAQLVACNRYGAGRAVDYRIGLIKRIGLPAVEALEADQEPRKWSVDELKAIKAHYKALLKELKGRAATC